MPETTTTSGSTHQETSPWAAQQPFLLDAFNKAQQNYGNASGNVYNGQQIAQFNPSQLDLFRSMVNYGSNSAIPGSMAAAGNTASNAGVNALTGSLNGLNNYSPTGGVGSNVAAAGQYADNPYISAQVDAATRDARRTADESLYPQIARNGAIRGNTNSSTTAIRQGMVDRGLAEQAGDISANLRGTAYNTGLNLAENGRQFDNTSRLGAMTSAGSIGGNAFNSGVGAQTGSIGAQGSLYGIGNQGGAGQQASTQAGYDNSRAMSEYANSTPSDLLSRYMQIVGGQSWGGTSDGTYNQTAEKQASPLSIAGGLLGGAGSLATGLGNFSNTSLGSRFFG